MATPQLPPHLKDHAELYATNPREAARAWFSEAKFGLFVHYALASLVEGGKPGLTELMGSSELVSKLELPEVEMDRAGLSEDEKRKCLDVKADLLNRFTAENFDAEAICDLAEAAEMKYVTLTTKHLGGMYLFDTAHSEHKSVNTAAGRDLVAEVSSACARRGLGYFHYVPPEFARTDGDYFDRNNAILSELLTNYGPVAGVWFDGIGKFYKDPENYQRLSETFTLIRELQPHALISFKEGAIGEEDFVSPEHFLMPTPVKWDTTLRQKQWEMRLERWKVNNEPRHHLFANALREINTVMQECWGRDGVYEKSGWINDEGARHLTTDEVWFLLKVAGSLDANLLMNVGPRPGGEIHPNDEAALKEVGRRIRETGYPH